MRRVERIALIWTVALAVTAWGLGTDWASNRLFTTPSATTFHDSYYLNAHRQYMNTIALALTGGAALYRLILWLGATAIRFCATVAILFWGLGIALVVVPQLLLSRQGMPRRYAELPDRFLPWEHVTSIGAFLAAASAVALIVILVVSLALHLRNRRARS